MDVHEWSIYPDDCMVDEGKTGNDALHTPVLVDTGGAVAHQSLTATSRADVHNAPVVTIKKS